MLRKFTTMRNFYTLLLFVLFSTITAHAQLSDFNLNVIKTNETCLGNGSLTFIVTNKTPNSAILYKVYLLPDITNPFTVLSGTTLGSLSAGTYKVVAIQTLGNLINQKEKTVTINYAVVPFVIDVSTSNQNCASGGNLIVTATSGIGASYEIISGPVTRPLQTSNIFIDMPTGTYNIRAFNNCGVAKVKTYTLTMYSNALSISEPIYPDVNSIVCDSIKVMHNITPSSGMIAYPVSVEWRLAPLNIGGVPIVVNETFITGDAGVLHASMVMPRYLTETYSYDIAVTDNCSTLYEKKNNMVDPGIDMLLDTGKAPCAKKFIRLTAGKYVTSYTVNIINAPADFIPSAFNATPNGPFTDSTIHYGSATNPVPFGQYILEITDMCGRKAIDTLSVEFVKPDPTVYAANNGCFSEYGSINVSVTEAKIISASITVAPVAYNLPLPNNIFQNITLDGKIVLKNMPLGLYTITFVDDCGFSYQVTIEVPPYQEQPFVLSSLPSCVPDFGTVMMKSGNGVLTAVNIISAPSSFTHPIPHNATTFIASNGILYMDNLPPGKYTFQGTDFCGLVVEKTVTVEGYTLPVDSFVFTPNCGAFSVTMQDSSNGAEAVGYWLQQYNEENDTWVNPFYNEAYIEGTVPTGTTGIGLNNNQTRNNLNFSGKFRIIKKFECYGNATSKNTICLSILGEFTYTEDLAITAAYTLACKGEPTSVILEIKGYPVLYKIKQKNGETFLVDNGPNNIFTNLEPAEYLFQIEDACGNIDIKGFNVQTLPSITDATKPSDMIVCTEAGTMNTYQYHLTDQDVAILGPLHSAMYTITYHLSQADADSGSNSLPEYYNNVSNGQIIYVRLVHNEIALCYGTTSFKLFIGEYPQPKIFTEGVVCNDGMVAITAEAGFKSYYWSNGETTRTIYVSEPGTYTVTVEKAYGDRTCQGTGEVDIITSVTPSIVKIDTSDWTRNENTITVHAEGSGNYEYSLDGRDYQLENVFTGLEAGVYRVFVRDGNGCGEINEEVVLLNYPNFFTPNGDGYNERWRIEYSIREPHMKVYIFDRYGKLITGFGSNSEGWDGTLNGVPLPSTDYWFVVTREDGRELKGHFSMLR